MATDAERSRTLPRHRSIPSYRLHKACGQAIVTIQGRDYYLGVWVAQVVGHKTEHFAKERVLFFGPRAQLILRRYLTPDLSAPLFHHTTHGYRRAVTRACDRAWPAPDAMRLRALARKTGISPGDMYKIPRRGKIHEGYLSRLRRIGKVKRHPQAGFYRPDAPPPSLQRV